MFLVLRTSKAVIFSARCKSDDECFKIYNENYECSTNGICKRVRFTYSPKEIIGGALVVTASMTTNAGGVGAGSIMISVLMCFFGFVSSDAIPLSRITIFAGSLVNYILNVNERDPLDYNMPILKYNLASVMMPLLLSGTMVGVLLSRFLPGSALTFVLILYLLSSLIQVFKRALKDHRREKEMMERSQDFEHKPTSNGESDKPDKGILENIKRDMDLSLDEVIDEDLHREDRK